MSPRVIDLTAPLEPGTVLWPGSEAVAVETVSEIRERGAFARVLRTPEHAGTHMDAPAHFVEDGVTVDRIPAERLVVPCAVLDVVERCEAGPDFTLEAHHLAELEARDGAIEAGSAVLVQTGWERFAADPARFLGGADAESLSFPGVGESAAAALVERGVVGLGIDTVSVDAGRATDFPVHHRTLPAGLWHLEGLVNLGALPARGATLVAAPLRLAGGSGAPARVLALVP